MKKIACLLCLLGLAFIMFLAVGCESLSGPEGKYVHRDSSRMDVYALVFEKKKVTIYNLGKELGTFSYEYKKDDNDKNKGSLTIKSDEYPWTFEYDYKNKELLGDVDGDGLLNLFVKITAETIKDK